MVIGILEILITAVISSGVVAYFFDRRLKRLASYEKTTNEMMGRMLIGAEQVLSAAKEVDDTVSSIETMVSADNFSASDLSLLRTELVKSLADLVTIIRAHRIYITPMMPMGESSVHTDSHTAMSLNVEHLLRAFSTGDEARTKDLVQALRESASRCHHQYHEMCRSVTKTMKGINLGKPIF